MAKTIEQHRADIIGKSTEYPCAACGGSFFYTALVNCDIMVGALRPIEMSLELVTFKDLADTHHLVCFACGEVVVARRKERIFPLMDTLRYLAQWRLEAEQRAEKLSAQRREKEVVAKRDAAIVALYANLAQPTGNQAGSALLRRVGINGHGTKAVPASVHA